MNDEKRKFLTISLISIFMILFSYIIMPVFVMIFFKDDFGSDPIVLVLTQLLGSVLPTLIIIFLINNNINKSSEYSFFHFNKIKKRDLIIILIISITSFFTIKFFSIFLENISVFAFNLLPPTKRLYNFDVFHFCLLLIPYALIPSLYEEFVYRGVFYSGGFNKISAYLLSVLPFALMHFPLINAISAFLLGTLYFIIREKKNFIIYLIIIHFINNFLSIIFANYLSIPLEAINVFQNATLGIEHLISAIWSLIISLLFLLVFIISMIYLKSDEKNIRCSKNKWSVITLIVVMSIFLFSAVINYIA